MQKKGGKVFAFVSAGADRKANTWVRFEVPRTLDW